MATATDYLGGLFGNPSPEPTSPMPETAPVPIDATDRGEPIDDTPEPAGGYEWGDAIDPPEPCPVCGSLARWWGVGADRRAEGWCQHCEGDKLARALVLAADAARLRGHTAKCCAPKRHRAICHHDPRRLIADETTLPLGPGENGQSAMTVATTVARDPFFVT